MAFTLRRLPSYHAFTIRTCKLLTRRWQAGQSVSRQSKVEPERACVDGRSCARFSVDVPYQSLLKMFVAERLIAEFEKPGSGESR